MAQRIIMHVDMDAFFVACEQRRDPTLIGKPVIVGGDPSGRGVVSTCSYEAREFGVHSAMPAAHAKRLCPQAIFLHGHMDDYVQTSRRLRVLFEEITPLVEMASLDEAYMDITGTEGLWGPPPKVAERLRDRIWESERLSASFGLGVSKTIAKIASDFEKPKGLTWVPPGTEADFLAPLPLRRLPGVGAKSLERLQGLGLATIGDLAALGEARLIDLFGVNGENLWLKSRGQDRGQVTPDSERKSLGRETTFATDVTDLDHAESILSRLAEEVAHRLRAKGLHARRVTLKFRHSDFTTFTRAQTLSATTNLEHEILQVARDLLHANWKRREPLRLLGISTSGFDEGGGQMDLLEDEKRGRLENLGKALDKIRDQHGEGAIHLGSSAAKKSKKPLPPWEIGGQNPG